MVVERMSEAVNGTYNAERGVYDNTGYAERVRIAAHQLNSLLKEAPLRVKVCMEIVDISTLDTRQEFLSVTVVQEI